MSSGGKINPSSRLYVGSLGIQATQKDLEELFGKHGKILEVRLNRNFAFVQFTTESEAKAAMEDLNGQNHFGRKLDVQFAKAPRSSSGNQDKNQSDNPEQLRDRSPLSKDSGRNDGGGGRGGRGGMRGGRGGSIGGRGPPSLFNQNDDNPFQSRDSPGFRDDNVGGFRGGDNRPAPFARDNGPPFNQSDNFRNEGRGGNFRGNNFRDNDTFNPWAENFRPGASGSDYRGPGGTGDFRDFHGGNDRDNFRDKSMLMGGFRGPQDRFGPRDQFRDSPAFRSDIDPWAQSTKEKDPWGPQELPPANPPVSLSVPNNDRINDIEIIVMNKSLTDYGEFIETRLKSLGFSVDLMFPNESALLSRVLGNIASRGTLYAIVVNPAHKVNRSLTLEVLHGTPQEHRNMLLEDAVTFLNRNYEAYTKSVSLKRGVETPPEQIRHLLELVISGTRKLTVPQFDVLIQHFIQEKLKLEPPVNQENSLPVTQQAELQTRILSILNKSGTGGNTPNALQQNIPQGVPPPGEQKGPSPLLKDPSVQRALDSLMQGGRNLFSNFNPGNQRGGSTFNQY
ncbi:nuclear receptor coactivator 5 isoform X2 [Cimex lectularius]|uniref:RRM domain-containing protein n=1 Tax=Cimex lectularius TaxID=79782 RepID=A0A8I6R8J5_CIMLE|nr:nuclear receptor coactivator 5 isoform X2 [Cimex lectularius]